jgi:hypothetical protein
MAQFLENNWAWILALAIGVLALWITIARSGESQGRSRTFIRLLIWGPFAASVEEHFAKRQGFSRRERYGIALLGLLMLAVLVMALLQD